jgi:tetratricopeptide (TPR) repeat protein
MANDHQPNAQQDVGAARPIGAVAKVYLTKARDAYKELLTKAADDPKFAPNEAALLAAKMQLGECYRGLGQYQPALDMFSEVLSQKEASLAVQRVAALTYQERGQKEDASYFENAIRGGIKLKSTGQNRIWGWIKISNVAHRASKTNESFKDAFFEARYNIGLCRYLAAMKKTGEARQKDLTTASQGLQSMLQLYPGLGGERWKPQFEKLMKDIEREESKKQPSADAA